MIELALRVVLSLAVVLGLLWMISRMTAKRLGGRRGGLVHVHARQPLGRSASVNVVTVGGKVLLIGVTENTVNLITELDADTVEQPVASVVSLVGSAPAERPAGDVSSTPDPQPDTGFAGVLAQVRGRTSRTTAVTAPVGRHVAEPAPVQALSGSLLSAGTWKQTFAAVSGRPSGGR